jgi:uroporphyrinogen-III synthase
MAYSKTSTVNSGADRALANLQGAGVLITRPLMQSAGMAALVDAHQGVAYVFPSLEITLQPFDELQASLVRVRAGDVLVFVSFNAVISVFNEISDTLRFQLASAQIAAIGERTQAALEAENLFVAISPEHGHQDSEGLLHHPLLQDLTGRHVYIVRGQSGRETLRETLLERGAQLDYIQAYTRGTPRDYDCTAIMQAFAAGQIQYVMLTSFAAFENLYQMLGSAADSILESAQLVAPGARVAQKIRDGYPFPVRIAKNASDREMLAAIG